MKLEKLWKIGVNDKMDLEERKQIMFSNGIYFIAGSVLLAAEIVMGGIPHLIENPSLRTFGPFLLIGLAGFSLFLNKIQYFRTSRILFLLCWSFIVSVLPIIVRGPSQVSFYFHPFHIILFSPVIHLLFSHPKDRFILSFFLLLSGLSVFFSVDFLLAFDETSAAASNQLLSRPLMVVRINFIALWFFTNLMMAYILKTNWNFYVAMREQKEMIALQQKQLQQQNEEQSIANKNLIDLNERFHLLNEVLEKRVLERTQELTERNKVLSEYAFMNAHHLRAPISRIKGLINLFGIVEDPKEMKIIQESLIVSSEELDQVVHSISKKLNEAN
ncbi:MAG: hypothetical protein HOP08_10785 [Cyclobacteriaceae bacterium]|nr:hypothetical protein [Cyclobacteriaceae bacterium]